MNVEDINDNAPVFDPSSYSNEVWENATRGTSILMVSATDIDDGSYQALISPLIERKKVNRTDLKIYIRGFEFRSNWRSRVNTRLH